MALEDLTGLKFIDAMVATNPVAPGDGRGEGDEHVRGIKNCITDSFPYISGPVNANQAELNVLVGRTSIDASFPADTGVLFRAAAAPTGWTQETVLSNLDGSTIRMTTSTGGGAVGGSHSLESAPSMNHSHTDTLVASAYALSTLYINGHFHYSVYNSSTTSVNYISSTEYMMKWGNNTGDRKYNFDQDSGTAAVARSASTGTGTGHAHTISGSIDSTGLASFAPKYTNVILCTKD